MTAGRTFALAWRFLPRLPWPLVIGLFEVAAHVTWVLRPAGVRQLERNLARLRPEAGPARARRMALQALRGYLRYYAEAFHMPGWPPEQLDARARAEHAERVTDEIAAGRSVVLALAHAGNWDVAGAWGARNLGPVVTVAERLEPPEVFAEFVSFRERNGVTIIPLDDGGGVFRKLLVQVRSGGRVVPLLADRDLTRNGVEVLLAGRPARVAAGPAALAVAGGVRLLPTHVRYERLRGERRRRAGSRYGTVMSFGEPVTVPEGTPRQEAVARLSQAWVDALGVTLAAHPTSWHMLQKVFVEDLDPARLQPAEGAI